MPIRRRGANQDTLSFDKPEKVVNVRPRPKPKVVDSDEFVSLLRKLCNAELGGMKLHVWPTNGGFQANIELPNHDTKGGWTCVTKFNPIEAIDLAIRQKLRITHLSQD